MSFIKSTDGKEWEINEVEVEYGKKTVVIKPVQDRSGERHQFGLQMVFNHKETYNYWSPMTPEASEALVEAVRALFEYVHADNPNRVGETVYIRDAIDKARQAVQATDSPIPHKAGEGTHGPARATPEAVGETD